jgi:formylmethanofuran dehydrogenase subunit E
MSDESSDIIYHSAICDECGNRTNAMTRELADAVTCAKCEEVPDWP